MKNGKHPWQRVVLDEARRTGLSPQLIKRRECNYKTKTAVQKRRGQSCFSCDNLLRPIFNGVEKTQCEILGVGNSKYCNVDSEHICDKFKKSCKRSNL